MKKVVIATFNGVHNASKSKILLVLAGAKANGERGLTLRKLAARTDVPYSSINSSVGKWIRWKYITRVPSMEGSRPVFLYKIAARGERFIIERIPPDIRAVYEKELAQVANRYGQPSPRLLATIERLRELRAGKVEQLSY